MNKLKKTFSIFLAFLPIIGNYATPIPGINLAELILIIFWLIVILNRFIPILKINKLNKDLFIFAILLLPLFLISSLFLGTPAITLVTLFRFLFYYVTIIFLGQILFDFKLFSKWVYRVSIFSIVFLILQYIIYYGFGKIISGHIPGLPLFLEIYENNGNINNLYFRPSSFFLEPASFAQYNFIALIIALWSKKPFLIKIFIYFSFILSTSAQGIIISTIIIIFYFISTLCAKETRITSKKVVRFLLLAIPTIIFGLIVFKSDLFQESINRIFNTNKAGAFYARLGEYLKIKENTNLLTLIIGRGFGYNPENVFLPSFIYIFYGTGLTGLFFILKYFIKAWFNVDTIRKCMILVCILTFIEASVIINLIVILYFCFITNSNSTKEIAQ